MCIYNNSKYTKWYYNIIFKALSENRKNDSLIYEKHHILPKCLFPQYRNLTSYPWNSVHLTFREHFIVHWLLPFMTIEKEHTRKMWAAARMMCHSTILHNRIMTSWQFEIEKIFAIKSSLGRIPWNKGLTKDSDIRVKSYTLKQTGQKRKGGKRGPQKNPQKPSNKLYNQLHTENVIKKCSLKKERMKLDYYKQFLPVLLNAIENLEVVNIKNLIYFFKINNIKTRRGKDFNYENMKYVLKEYNIKP